MEQSNFQSVPLDMPDYAVSHDLQELFENYVYASSSGTSLISDDEMLPQFFGDQSFPPSPNNFELFTPSYHETQFYSLFPQNDEFLDPFYQHVEAAPYPQQHSPPYYYNHNQQYENTPNYSNNTAADLCQASDIAILSIADQDQNNGSPAESHSSIEAPKKRPRYKYRPSIIQVEKNSNHKSIKTHTAEPHIPTRPIEECMAVFDSSLVAVPEKRRRKLFNAEERQAVRSVRSVGACVQCRLRKKTCSAGTPCPYCIRVSGSIEHAQRICIREGTFPESNTAPLECKAASSSRPRPQSRRVVVRQEHTMRVRPQNT